MLVARDVEVTVAEGVRILGPVSLEVAPGQMVALMGQSGSGKSTLMKVLSGIAEPTAGSATWAGTPMTQALHTVGYVQQRESVHERLTTEEAIAYAAALRVPSGVSVDQRVNAALEELGLVRQRNTQIRNLSGGERRRAACGLELVGDPHVLLLDEPTSGLDVMLERRLMQLFRRLADRGRAVLVVTHATASLDLCDEVMLLGDGRFSHRGDPRAAKAYLESVARQDDEVRAAPHNPAADTAALPSTATRPFWSEVRTLAARYRKTMLRDTRTLAILLGQAPAIGVLIAIVFHPGALDTGAAASNAVELFFMLTTGAIWLGIASASREVVKERGLVEREFDVGVRLDAYIIAKALVIFVLVTVQVVLLVGITVAMQPPHIDGGEALELLLLCILAGWTAASLGLAVSCVARTVDQAAGAVPLLLMPQLVFAGALVPLARMPGAIAGVADAAFSRWAYAGIGHATEIGGRLNADSNAAALGFSKNFFTLGIGVCAGILLGFTVLQLLAATFFLRSRPPLNE